MFGKKKKSTQLANKLAEKFKGEVVHPNLWMTLLRICHHCVKTKYKQMKMEIYVCWPIVEIEIQNFRLKYPQSNSMSFSINKPSRVPYFDSPIDNLFKDKRLLGYTYTGDYTNTNTEAIRKEAARKFCGIEENEKDFLELALQKEEMITIHGSQIRLHNKGATFDKLVERIEVISQFFLRNSSLSSYCYTEDVYEITRAKSKNRLKVSHKLGGIPSDIPLNNLPECCNCNHPLHLIVQIDTSDSSLKLRDIGSRYLHVLSCLNCDSYCQPMYYEYNDAYLKLLSQEKGETYGEFPEIIEEKPISIIKASLDEIEGKRHFLGGSPTWIQSEDIPKCIKCGKEMKFIIQIDSDEDARIQFGDCGILYCFICVKCKVITTFMQGY